MPYDPADRGFILEVINFTTRWSRCNYRALFVPRPRQDQAPTWRSPIGSGAQRRTGQVFPESRGVRTWPRVRRAALIAQARFRQNFAQPWINL